MLGDSAEGCVYVVDSHSHGPSYGALIAVSSPSSSVRTIAVYLSEFFHEQFCLSQTIGLQTGNVVSRE